MTRNVKYAQCAMRRIVAGASVVTTSYIPTQFAKVGRVLKLKDSDDRWVDGWVVETCRRRDRRRRQCSELPQGDPKPPQVNRRQYAATPSITRWQPTEGREQSRPSHGTKHTTPRYANRQSGPA